ncbi:hypothetical protein T190611E02C_10059 [Tenacibaculum sp. 190524A05c]
MSSVSLYNEVELSKNIETLFKSIRHKMDDCEYYFFLGEADIRS